MPCPFAPLVGLLPTLLAIPYLVSARLRRMRRLTQQKFGDLDIRKAEEENVTLNTFGYLRAPLAREELESMEFYREKTPHYREQRALHCGSSGDTTFLLFDAKACPKRAKRAAEILSDSGVGFARVKDAELQLKVKDSECFRKYGLDKIMCELRAL